MRAFRLAALRARRAVGARRGVALPVALMLLVVLSTLAAGSFTASRQTFRGGRNALIEQRALSVSEFGLNQQVANWPTQLNLPAPRGLASAASTRRTCGSRPATRPRCASRA
jgi:Tfp pilus assembly protein PilX